MILNTACYKSITPSYFAIWTPEDLISFANTVNSGKQSLSARVFADLDVDGLTIPKIGPGGGGATYYGTFDGGGHTISNFTTTDTSLFGYVFGSIKNLGMINTTIQTGGYAPAGPMCMQLNPSGLMENCYSINTTISCSLGGAGGISGLIHNGGTINNCYSYNTEGTTYKNKGGIVASSNYSGNLNNCATYGGNGGNACVGGGTFTATNCYSASDVSSEVFHNLDFWNGNIGGSLPQTYLTWDFVNTWEWDPANNLPKLRGK